MSAPPGHLSRPTTSREPRQAAPVSEPVRQPGRLLTESELRELPSPQWLIEGVIQAASFVVIWGPPASFKTFAAVAMAGAVVTGLDWLGPKVLTPGAVAYVPADDLYGFRDRWDRWWCDTAGYGYEKDVPMFTWKEELNLFDGNGFDAFLAEVRRVRPSLIVLDTWARLIAGGDENQQKDTTRAIQRVDALRREGATVLALHHSGVEGKRERGSSALGAAADTVISFSRDQKALEVRCEKQRNGAPFAPLRLTFDPGALVLRPVGVSPAPQLPKRQASVLDALMRLATQNGGSIEIGVWRERCFNVEGIPKKTFYDSKKKLIDGGHVRELDDGTFAPA